MGNTFESCTVFGDGDEKDIKQRINTEEVWYPYIRYTYNIKTTIQCAKLCI